MDKRSGAVTIQSAERGRVSRAKARDNARWRKEDPQHAEALKLVTELICIDEGPKTAPKIARSLIAMDFLDEVELGIPGTKHMTRGAKEYLNAATVRSYPRIEAETVPLWATRTVQAGVHMETSVEREVLLPGGKPARIEYIVRHGRHQRHVDNRITHRRVTAARALHVAQLDEDGVESPPKNSVNKLRESFAKLDADGSGHLSLGEIISASSLVGLRFKADELQQQLLAGDNDGDGTFELHELDAILRKDRVLESLAVERSNRPLIFDVLPIVARTFDAHSVVESCLQAAAERDRAIIADQRKMRVAASRSLTDRTDMHTVKQTAQRDANKPTRKPRPRHVSEPPPSPKVLIAKRKAAQSTAELAEIVESFEERIREQAETTEDVKELAEFQQLATEINDVCAAANKQREKVSAALSFSGKMPARHHQLSRGLLRSKSSAFERPRRPHHLTPLGTDTGGKGMPPTTHLLQQRERQEQGLPISVSQPVLRRNRLEGVDQSWYRNR